MLPWQPWSLRRSFGCFDSFGSSDLGGTALDGFFLCFAPIWNNICVYIYIERERLIDMNMIYIYISVFRIDI